MKRIALALVFILFTINSTNAQWCAKLTEYKKLNKNNQNSGVVQYYKKRCECERGQVVNEEKWIKSVNKIANTIEAYFGNKYGKFEKVTRCAKKKLNYSYDYYFANHTTCAKNLKFTIDGTNLGYTIKAGDELKINIPYNTIKIRYKVPCDNSKTTTVNLKPGGTIFWSQPKTRDHIFDSMYLTLYDIKKLNKNKRNYKIKFKNTTYGVKEINVSGTILKLKRNKVYYYRKTSYFPPKHYDKVKRKSYNPADGSYYVFKNTKNGSGWFRN